MEKLPSSSQDSIYEWHKIFLDQENVDSSPLRTRGTSIPTSPKKQRTAPTITPRRFKKFFTPRSSLSSRGYRQGKSGRQLRDITKNGINRQPKFRPLFPDDSLGNSDDDFPSYPSPKRRKITLDIASSPPISSPIKGTIYAPTQLPCLQDVLLSPTVSEVPSLPMPCRLPVQRLRRPGPTRRILERSFGEYDACRGRRGPDHAGSPDAETANFYTTSQGLHDFRGVSLPFCVAACNTNSLTAIGDEDGTIHLIDSSPKSDFGSTHINFRAHHNAIMDLEFSSDDYLLATASGDQTSLIIDMLTQRSVCVLTGHMGTIKQARFSPANNNILYTSSKDGTVQIWDLRLRSQASVAAMQTSSSRFTEPDQRLETNTRYAQTVLAAFQGHRVATRPIVDPFRPELSITAIRHMPHGREHLLLTASEVNASIKLWDLRNANRQTAVPLSSTELPESHARSRNYGITSLVISGDGGRLYATCRDAAVHVYSTTQLALGCVPEMSTQPGRRRLLQEPRAGAAPLYSFSNPSLRVDTFYVKASLRPSQGDKGELLAVGSSEGSPVLFSTDERHTPHSPRERAMNRDEDDTRMDDTELPTIPQTSSQRSFGAPLVGAHRREVTSVAWTHGGDLVSISDDHTARCWREDAEKARHLRTCGESGGERWLCGWAKVANPQWDESDL